MARVGFIHDKLDIKFLILYILARVVEPIDFVTLTGLVMCDEGVDYFSFAESLAELADTKNVLRAQDRYSLTEKGRCNNAVCEDSLPLSVRQKCDKNVAHLNAVLRRNAQVKAEVLARPNGTFTLLLSLSDDKENILTIRLFCASQVQAERLAERFKANPEQIYNSVLEVLSPPQDAE